MRIAATLLAGTLLLAGCGDVGSDPGPQPSGETSTPGPTPSASAGPTPAPDDEAVAGTTVDIVIEDGEVTPQGGRVEATVGDPVTLRITTDADEEIHVHSDPEHSYEVAAGETVTESFTIDAPGQVAVEAHHLDATIVQLVVRP